MTTEQLLQALIDDKNSLVSLLNTKNIPSNPDEPLSTLISKINEIQEVTDEWQPHPEWWNIKNICDTGILPWNNEHVENIRYAALFCDNTSSLPLPTGVTTYTSDGEMYTDGGTHVWDVSKDKPCSEGYKTRVVVFCSGSRDLALDLRGASSMYVYMGDCNLTSFIMGSSSSSSSNTFTEAVKCGELTTCNSAAYNTSYSVGQCLSLNSVDIPQGVTSFGGSYAFRYNYSLQSLYIPDGVTSFSTGAFQDCYNLRYLRLPNTINSSLASTLFSNLYSLVNLELQQNFNAGISLPVTVPRISNTSYHDMVFKAQDRSQTTALVWAIGSSSISRLLPETIALAAAKNITLS